MDNNNKYDKILVSKIVRKKERNVNKFIDLRVFEDCAQIIKANKSMAELIHEFRLWWMNIHQFIRPVYLLFVQRMHIIS